MMSDRINIDHNKNYSNKRIYKIMKILGIQSMIHPKCRSYTVKKNNNTANNNPNRDFNASKPNEKWVTDVTEFKYGPHNEYKLYLNVFLDLYDRTVVSYEIGNRNNNRLVFFSHLIRQLKIIVMHILCSTMMEGFNIQIQFL